MAIFPFSVDSVRIGTANITASGGNIVLPAGTQVGNQTVATVVEVSTGGGPKITNLQITDNSWAVLDDTAVDTTGGYILITGTNFVTGALVYFNQTAANSVAFVSATTLQVTVPALTAGTYIVYVVNPDGGTAIRVPGLTASANPAWQTGSNLGEQYDGIAISLSLVATDATSYTLTSGSLPPGLSLNANTGVITGTVTGVTVDTVYTFTVRATDAQLQDSPRTFTVTITVSDPYFKLTTLLLSGAAISGNTVIRDSSNNGSTLIVYGDTRASNFTPYGTGWSVQFDGNGDYLSLVDNAAFAMGSGNWTLEAWVYLVSYTGTSAYGFIYDGRPLTTNGFYLTLYHNNGVVRFFTNNNGVVNSDEGSTVTLALGQWYHIAVSKSGNATKMFVNGVQTGNTYTDNNTYINGASRPLIGANSFTGPSDFLNGYISNLRLVKGTALYTANFTPATTNLTSVANTSLLTCHANRFLDGSTNNFAITRNGDAAIRSFNPFNITNTGVDGSAYFDGTGDYISLADNAAFNLSSGSFTIEAWVYPISVATNVDMHIMAKYSAWVFWIDDATLKLGFDDNATLYLQSSANAIVLNTWSHVAIVRNTATPLDALFINGIQVASSSSLRSIPNNSNSVFISGNSSGWPGYISNLRLTKAAVYTGNFTPPAQPLTAIANTQLLTLQYDQPHNNHTFLDSSSNQFLITRNGNASQGTFSPFSQTGWSNYFDGTANGSLRADSTTDTNLSGDFTIQAWVYPTANGQSNNSEIISRGAATTLNGWRLGLIASTTQPFFGINYASSGNTSTCTQSSTNIPLNQWTYVAVTRSGNTCRIYINGVLDTTNTGFTGTPTVSGTEYVYVGRGSYDTTNRQFTGYINNASIIKGTALTTFSQTQPLATSTSGQALLTCTANRFIDTNAATTAKILTAGSGASVQTFSPFAPTAVYTPAVHGGSAYFDGSDYLVTPNSNNLTLSGDFTLQFWIYPTAAAGTHVWDNNNVSVDRTIQLNANSDGMGYFDGTANRSFGTSARNSWSYIVMSRTGSTIEGYLNGVRGFSITDTATLNFNSAWLMRRQMNTQTVYGTGYIANFRLIKGTGLFTGTNISVPTAPLTATTDTQLLLNFTDAAILDSTGRNAVETVADAKSTSVVTKFTGGSMLFDGTGDWTIIPTSPNFGYGTGDFTIELWLYWTGSGTQTIVSNLTADASTNPHLYIGTNVLKYFTVGADRITGPTLSANQWYHIAISRSSGSTRLFVNGTQSGSTYADSNNYGTTAPFALGTYWNNGTPSSASTLSGYVSDLRITRGYARYTANFTAPTVPARLK